MNPDRNYSDATTATASHDERRVSIYLRALEEFAKSNPECHQLIMYINENMEKYFHNLIQKKSENDKISIQIDNVNKQLQHEKASLVIASVIFRVRQKK
jgi:hypothetical protein